MKQMILSSNFLVPSLIIALLEGMWTAMSGTGLFILIIIGLLTGANLTLLFTRLGTFAGGSSLFK